MLFDGGWRVAPKTSWRTRLLETGASGGKIAMERGTERSDDVVIKYNKIDMLLGDIRKTPRPSLESAGNLRAVAG